MFRSTLPKAMAVLILFALVLSGCTITINPITGDGGMDHSQMNHGPMHESMHTATPAAEEEHSMDHGAMHTATPAPEEEAADSMDHGAHDAHAAGDIPFDAQFIDGMIVHHQGALDMAAQVLAESERPEMLAFAEAIIAAQDAEIAQMQAWRAAWYPDLPGSEGMDMDMGDMEISDDGSIPFDQRFLTAMISHHKGAVEMARAALELAEHDEIRALAEEIIAAQEAEIAQMEAWLLEWFDVELDASHSGGHSH